MRKSVTRFGTFGRKAGTPVYSDELGSPEGWWLCVVEDVRLDGATVVSEHLSEHVGPGHHPFLSPLLQHGQDACWVRASLPILFQCRPPASYTAHRLLDLGLVAIRR